MHKITVLALALVWLSSPAQCFADDANSAAKPAQPRNPTRYSTRNATLTPKTRLVGVDNPCHRRKLKLSARIAATATDTQEDKASVGCPAQPAETPPEYNQWKYTIWAGP